MKKRIIILACLGLSVISVFGFLFVLTIGTRAAPNTTINVDTTDDELNSDGDCSLREAIVAANTDAVVDACPAGSGADTVILPTGTYTLTIAGTDENASATGDLDITESVEINGAGAISTTIDGNTLDRVFHINPDQLFGVNVSVNDLTVRNGHANQGGGLYVDAAGVLTITNSTIYSNTAMGTGGGLYNFSRFSRLSIYSSTISNNSASDPTMLWEPGGGIYNEGGVLTVVNSQILNNSGRGIDSVLEEGIYFPVLTIEGCTISGNSGGIYNHGPGVVSDSLISENQGFEDGGGIKNGVTIEIHNSQILSNTTQSSGGGISSSGPMTITNSTITHNVADGKGGGIAYFMYVYEPSDILNVQNSIITDNTASDSGGGIYSGESSEIHVTDSTVSENHSSGFEVTGGGISSEGRIFLNRTTIVSNTVTGFNTNGGGINLAGYGSDASIKNSTLSGNSADAFGGGLNISFDPGSPYTITLNNVTVTDNTADAIDDDYGDGGGIHSLNGAVVLQNSLVAGNHDLSSGADHPDCSGAIGSIVSNGYNLVGIVDGCNWTSATGDLTGTLSSPLDPLLGPLADNGGPTLTHALLMGSPALNAANPAFPGSSETACETTDQRDRSRYFQGPACDMGAFEWDGYLHLYMPSVVRGLSAH